MKKTIYLFATLFVVSCGNKVPISNPSSNSNMADSIQVEEDYIGVDSVIVDVDNYSLDTSYEQIIFRPVQATISDSQGTFSSSTFDCPNMVVCDKGSYVQLSWGGEDISLYESGNSPDIYTASQTSPAGVSMKFSAYRSSGTREIYLVICTTISENQRCEINFKP